MDDFDLYDVWDIEDNREDSIFLEQALISRKKDTNPFSVNRQYVNSKEYHDKFEQLPVNDIVQESLYKQAGRLLEFLDGQDEERLLAVNARTGELIVDNFDRPGYAKNTAFTTSEYQKIQDCIDTIILMHNHSLNGRPSAADLLSCLKDDKIRLSLILCHDGTIHAIYSVKEKFKELYSLYMNDICTKTTNREEAKRLAMTKLYQDNQNLNNRYKLFDVRKL